MSEELTDFVIETAAQHGITVKSINRAPNGGEVVYFNFPKVDNAKRNPYFMIWTDSVIEGMGWHLELGHWYQPKNRKESKAYPPTYGVGNDKDKLKEAIADVANRIGT